MSRSRKKHPITGITTSETEKEFGNRWKGPKDGRTDWTGLWLEEKAKRK
jgi:hypothetical protein